MGWRIVFNLTVTITLLLVWLLDRPAFRRSGIPTALFCGILFSGHMDADRVRAVLPLDGAP